MTLIFLSTPVLWASTNLGALSGIARNPVLIAEVFTVITNDIQFTLQELKEFAARLKLQTRLSMEME